MRGIVSNLAWFQHTCDFRHPFCHFLWAELAKEVDAHHSVCAVSSHGYLASRALLDLNGHTSIDGCMQPKLENFRFITKTCIDQG